MGTTQIVEITKGPCWKYDKDPVSGYVYYTCCLNLGEGDCIATFKVCWNELFQYLMYQRIITPPVYSEEKPCPQEPLKFFNYIPNSQCYFICDN